jgi:protein-S-isoprenylcysteine O-methyltransferase Ste14
MHGRIANVLSRALLVLLFATFAWANFHRWRTTGQPSGLGTTLLEGWVAALFLVRRRPSDVSSRPLAWAAATVGSFAMLLARPAPGGLAPFWCEALQLLGVAVTLLSLGTLGRSFGIVAANRGVKTRGPYRFVRHPAYAGYFIAYLGYVLENPSPTNTFLLLLATGAQVVRIEEEERVLVRDPAYSEYRLRVPRRLIPFVY